LRETPPPPHEVEPTIPVAIERAILKCLEKEPAKRFQSVAELEKVLGGPGLTGTSSGLAPFAVSPQNTPTLVHLPSPAAVQEKSSHVSPVIWVLFGGVLVFAGLAGAQWAKNAKAAEQIPPPPSLPAPKPPDFALTNPASESPAPVETKAAKPVEKKPVEKKAEAVVPQAPPPTTEAAEPSKPVSTGGFPAVELPGKKKSARQQELEGTTPPAAVQQRADKAFGETNSTDTQETMYLWVGRYQQEDKANQVVKKIKGFGLPVAAIQRTGLTGPFWIVVTGPFTPKRVSDVTQWLEAQGYLNVHEFKLPGAKPTPGTQPK
jgi:hypothetical protein